MLFGSLRSQFRSTFFAVLFLQSFLAAHASVVVIEWLFKKLVINIIHQGLYLFQLNASIVDTNNHERMPCDMQNMLRPVAFAALGGEEVVVMKITLYNKTS